MTEEKIKAGVIGVGYLGRFHALRWKEIPGAQLVGVTDASPERAAQIAREAGCRAFENNEQLLEQCQAVSIVVPTIDHHAVAKKALAMGKDILLEKPITMTLEEADDLIEIGRAKKCVFMVGHLERFNPAVRAMIESLSRPAFIEVHRLGSFTERAANIDVVRDLMIHDLDIILSLVRAKISRISAVGVALLSDKIDIANARLEFENGSVANITASRVTPGEPTRKIRVFQPENYISIDYQKKQMAVFSLGKGEDKNPMSRIKIKQVPIDDDDALRTELGAFAQAVRFRGEPPVTCEDGRRALETALLINKEIAASIKKFYMNN